jgi:hypothetical protein
MFRKALTSLFLAFFLIISQTVPVMAQGQVLGVHILHPYEITDAKELVDVKEGDEDTWHYVTIPLTLDDIKKEDEWRGFFQEAKKQKIIPLVRLSSRFENGAWKVPNRKEIVDLITFLEKLEWPTDKKYIMVFNEVNHAKEWGGRIDPAEYAEILQFTADWAHSEQTNFIVMPAAMDLAAPNGSSTMEAFTYLNAMLAYNPEILNVVDVWNSHSYPNPGFSSSPERTTKNSLRGYQHELAFVKEKTGRDLQVMITETGWVKTPTTSRTLESYYTYALQHIWSDSRIIAVTPFVLRGDPGPFSGFTFLDKNGKPTVHYAAMQNALKKVGS